MRHPPYEAEDAVTEAALKQRTTALIQSADSQQNERDMQDADKAEQDQASAALAANEDEAAVLEGLKLDADGNQARRDSCLLADRTIYVAIAS